MIMNKQWRCRNGHTLGLVMANGADAPQLMIYRHAIDAGAEHPAEVDVMIGPVTGMMLVQCDLCGDVRVWQISVASLLYLVEAMPTHLLFEFWRRLLEREKMPGLTPPPTPPHRESADGEGRAAEVNNASV